MAVKRVFFIRRLIALGSVVFGVVVLCLLLSLWLHRLSGDKEIRIVSGTKFELQPYKWKSNRETDFHVAIETFQNPPMLNLDLAKTALLVDELDNPYKPIKWILRKRTGSRVEGDLIFTAGPHRPKQLNLIVFTSEETQFHWSF